MRHACRFNARLMDDLVAEHGWRKKDEEDLLHTVTQEVEAAAQAFLDSEPEAASAMVDTLFETAPSDIAALAEELRNG